MARREPGLWRVLSLLASLTTLVGVTSACGDYFSKFSTRFSYPFWIVFFTAMTTIISQYGLTKLLRVTIPALLLIYPMAIMLVVLQLVRNKLPSIRLSYYTTIFVTVCFSLIDSLKNLDMLPEGYTIMTNFPLYSQGLAWLVPALCTLVLSIIFGKRVQNNKNADNDLSAFFILKCGHFFTRF